MVEFKLVIGDPKSGKCYQKVVSEQNAASLVGKKIGDHIKGEAFDMTGYEFEISGGADYCGFPMRKDIEGPVRKKILLVKGVGIRNKDAGIRRRKTICGNTIHEKISQVCLKVLKEGKKPLEEPKEGETPATPAAAEQTQAPKEAHANKPKKEDKPAKVHKEEGKKE